jgi:hypothetical protein
MKNTEYTIKLKVGWEYDSTPDDLASSFGILKIYPYDDVIEDYSSTSIVVYEAPTGSRKTFNN